MTDDAALATLPPKGVVPTVHETDTGVVVWHREHLRTSDHPALAAAARMADSVLPLFVFDPAFYGPSGLACDARLRFLDESLADLDAQYQEVGGELTLTHGDPLDVLSRFHEAGWDILAADGPTGRYGHRRDERAHEELDALFVSGDGLVRGTEWSREGWTDRMDEWFDADPYEWDLDTVELEAAPTNLSIDDIEQAYDVVPEKTQIPPGGRTEALARLDSFLDRIHAYPGSLSAPSDAREGTSGLSPYLRFGCLSLRETYNTVTESEHDRGREMFISRLYWNKHYAQKLEDWPGWLDTAVNPVFEGFNADTRDEQRIAAWKQGKTGYPMVDAAMRCLRQTGWLNFRMRAMCVSTYFHLLAQPWQEGADWYHHHLIDSDPAINYTQWQSQCGLIGTPTIRLYNPRKQVRDHDPDGEWIRRWVPELRALPDEHLAQPEKTPPDVQADCGVTIGETYPYPIVEFEQAKEQFWRRYNAIRPDAAHRLGSDDIARRASLSGGRETARSIAADVGTDASDARDGDTPADPAQTDLTRFE